MMAERTFEGLVYEWSQKISKENPNKRIGGITLKDIKQLKRMLDKFDDEKMRDILDKWAENERKLLEEKKELKNELLILRKLPTPGDFQEEYEKLFNKFIKKLKKKTFWVNGYSQLCDEIDELNNDVFHAVSETEDKK